MCIWVRGHYRYAASIAMALAIEYTSRFKKVHACAEHALWLAEHEPPQLEYLEFEEKTYISKQGIPECMPEEHWDPDVVKAYQSYYKTKTFARWTIRE